MNLLHRYILLATILLTNSVTSTMENTQVTITTNHLKIFREILSTHQPLGKAIPFIKQLEKEDPTWVDILKDKQSCRELLNFINPLDKSLENKTINAIFIGTNGMIECAKDYIKKEPAIEQKLNNMLVDTGLWVHTSWDNQAPDVANAILQVTGKPNATNELGETALMSAVKNGHFPVVKTLLSAGANPNIETQDKETALTTINQIVDNYKTIAVVLFLAKKIHDLQ